MAYLIPTSPAGKMVSEVRVSGSPNPDDLRQRLSQSVVLRAFAGPRVKLRKPPGLSRGAKKRRFGRDPCGADGFATEIPVDAFHAGTRATRSRHRSGDSLAQIPEAPQNPARRSGFPPEPSCPGFAFRPESIPGSQERLVHETPASDDRAIREITDPAAQQLAERDFSVLFAFALRRLSRDSLAQDPWDRLPIPAHAFRCFSNRSSHQQFPIFP